MWQSHNFGDEINANMQKTLSPVLNKMNAGHIERE